MKFASAFALYKRDNPDASDLARVPEAGASTVATFYAPFSGD
jgi:hypothetical protein